MKIVEINAENNGKTGGRKELGAAEKWLFDAQDGEIRLKTLMNMTAGQQGIAELEEFKSYGSYNRRLGLLSAMEILCR